MKKLNKLEINSERIMKSEELMTLKGGYGGSIDCCCIGPSICGTAGSLEMCKYMCSDSLTFIYSGA